jgi:NTE family protein
MKALVLSGGGARGAYEAGVLVGLANSGERFDLVCGTSIGAINASFLALDLLEDLEQLWRTIATRNIITLIPQAQHVQEFVVGFEDFLKLPLDAKIFRIPHIVELFGRIGSKVALLSLLGIVDRTPLTKILTGKLNVNNLTRSLIITATNITQETADSFYAFVQSDGIPDSTKVQSAFLDRVGTQNYALSNTNFLSAVEASASIPLAFDPVTFNHGTGRDFLYVDGGVANNTPIGLAIAAGATDIIVVFMDPKVSAPPYQVIPNAAILGMACYDVMQQKILADDMKLALMTNKALSAADTQKQKELGLNDKVQVTLRVVRPNLPLDLTVLAFSDQAKLTAAFELGRSDASQIQTLWPPN